MNETNESMAAELEQQAMIMIVDDEPLALEMADMALQRQGFRTATARDGGEALDRLEETNPDLVLLDITMPGVDGFTVFQRMRERDGFGTLPVIFVTARDAIDEKIRGLELGAIDYITKPYNPSELVARVRATLRMQALEREIQKREREHAQREAVETLLITLSHHINNSVAVMQGRADITDPDDREAVEKLIDVVQRRSRKVSDVLAVIEELLEQVKLKTTSYISEGNDMFDIDDLLQKRTEEAGRGE